MASRHSEHCSFDVFLARVGAPSRHTLGHASSRYFVAQFWDLEEDPLPELESVIRKNFPTLQKARIQVRGCAGYDMECEVRLVLSEPRQLKYCDLAIVSNGQHAAEPWSIDAEEIFDIDGSGEEGVIVVEPGTAYVGNEG
ncbi:hypothetical protein DL768_006713 [Monosporascus sp. mg162]|nr:hypothetical protein DL768_006713 [Monosporascus sp. mg162]